MAPPRERRRPAGWRLGRCSCRRPARSTRAGAAGAAAVSPTTVRATVPQTDHPGTIPARAKRRAATPMEPRLARARASPVSLAVGVLERGLRPMARRKRGCRGASELARGYPFSGEILAVLLLPVLLRGWRGPLAVAFPLNAGRGSGAPACPAPGPAQQRGSPPAPRAYSPRPHHRSTARPAVQAPASIGARARIAHPLRPAFAGNPSCLARPAESRS